MSTPACEICQGIRDNCESIQHSCSLLSKMMREAHPIEAAERRQYVAPGASPGISALSSVSTVGATDSVGSFAPTGLDLKNNIFPGLTPGATYCRRSAAQ